MVLGLNKIKPPNDCTENGDSMYLPGVVGARARDM